MSERRVTVYVRESSEVELTTQETVRLDRLAHAEGEGFTSERHGELLRPAMSAGRFALYVACLSEVEMTARETVRLDRLTHAGADGFGSEPYALIRPGAHAVRLGPGVYHFRAMPRRSTG